MVPSKLFCCEKRKKNTRITGVILALVVTASWSRDLMLTQNWIVLFKHDGPHVRVLKMSDSQVHSMDRELDDKLSRTQSTVRTSSSSSLTAPLHRASLSSSSAEMFKNNHEQVPVSGAATLQRGKDLTKKYETNLTVTVGSAPVRNKTVNRMEADSTTGNYPLIVNTVHSIGRRDYGSCLDPISAKEDGRYLSIWELRILCGWQNFTESPEVRRQVVNAIDHGKSQQIDGEITLATQGSVDRLKRLVDVTARWNGPISVAIHVNSRESLTKLFDFYRAKRAALNKTTFHLFFEKVISPRDKQYRKSPLARSRTFSFFPCNSHLRFIPAAHNYLRNLAMNNVQTEYVINIDIDFCLNENAHDGLVKLLQSDETVRENLDNRTMLILPAFENTFHIEEEDVSRVPKNKAEVTEQVKVSKTTEAFHLNKYFAGHGKTNFEKWYANETGVMYDVEYERGFEPYVLAKKAGLPQFWTKFRGFGCNKKAWLEEAHRAGYKFEVLRDYFVFHVGQSSTQLHVQSWVRQEYHGRFSAYLDNHYPQKKI